MIEGLSHITFVVRDLDATGELLTTIFDAEEVYSSGDRRFSLFREKFFLVGGVWIAIMEGNPRPENSYDHVAFKIRDEEYDEHLTRIRALGLEIREGRARTHGEGRSIYFYDYDNHLFELHTSTLRARLARYEEHDLGNANGR